MGLFRRRAKGSRQRIRGANKARKWAELPGKRRRDKLQAVAADKGRRVSSTMRLCAANCAVKTTARDGLDDLICRSRHGEGLHGLLFKLATVPMEMHNIDVLGAATRRAIVASGPNDEVA